MPLRLASILASAPGRGLAPAWLIRRALILPAVAGLLLAMAGVAVATTPPTHPAAVPAAEGPGLRAPADSISATAAQTCAAVAAKAGFSYARSVAGYPQMVVAVAVAMAESSCNPSAEYVNSNGCVDRGLWQIDNCAHPNVSDTCAYQTQCNADAAYTISTEGTDWSPWSTYESGVWENYISDADAAVSGFVIQLKDQGDGTCLDADSADVGNGGKIFQWTCNSSDNYQRWQVIDAYPDNPVLKNVGAGTCLDADGAAAGNADPIFQWTCNSKDSAQQWWFGGSGDLNTNGNADATLHSWGDGTCLDGDGTDSGNGAPIFQWTCSSSDSFQRWN
jgi:hypothetical protein